MTPSRIFIVGHREMVGSAIHRFLQTENIDVIEKKRSQLDPTNTEGVRRFFLDGKNDGVYLAVAKVGGGHANNICQADFIANNLSMQLNIIQSAFHTGVQKILSLGSLCIYMKFVKQPMPDGMLLSGALEATNEPYALEKITGIKLCRAAGSPRKLLDIFRLERLGWGDNISLQDGIEQTYHWFLNNVEALRR